MADPQLLMLFWEVLETSGWGWLEEGDTGVSLIPSCHTLSFLLSQEDSFLLRRGPHCHLLSIHVGSHNCPQNSESIRKCTSLQLFLQHLVTVIEKVTRRLLNVLVNISWSPCWKLTKYPHTTAQHTFLGVVLYHCWRLSPPDKNGLCLRINFLNFGYGRVTAHILWALWTLSNSLSQAIYSSKGHLMS